MQAWLIIFVIIFGFVAWIWDHPNFLSEAVSNNRLIEQQSTLERYATASNKIDKILVETIKKVPTAARIRVAFIHLSPNTPELLRYDITNSTTTPGHPVGELTSDHLISEWSDFFNKLLNNQCADVDAKTVTSSVSLARINSLQIRRFLACPIYNEHHQFLGAAFMSWDINDANPGDMSEVETLLRSAANQIGRDKV